LAWYRPGMRPGLRDRGGFSGWNLEKPPP
jgi:hypothetical protein